MVISDSDTLLILKLDSELNFQEKEKSVKRILNFNHFKGFKKLEEQDKWKNHYMVDKKLGKGNYGTVWKAVHIKAKSVCAIKIIRKKKLN